MLFNAITESHKVCLVWFVLNFATFLSEIYWASSLFLTNVPFSSTSFFSPAHKPLYFSSFTEKSSKCQNGTVQFPCGLTGKLDGCLETWQAGWYFVVFTKLILYCTFSVYPLYCTVHSQCTHYTVHSVCTLFIWPSQPAQRSILSDYTPTPQSVSATQLAPRRMIRQHFRPTIAFIIHPPGIQMPFNHSRQEKPRSLINTIHKTIQQTIHTHS